MKIKSGIMIWISVIIGVSIVSGIILSYVVSEKFHDYEIQRAIQNNADIIRNQARLHLAASDFDQNNLEQRQGVFKEFSDQVRTNEIVKIVAWSTDKTVLYSNEEEDIGKKFADNDELEEAMKGQVIAEAGKEEAGEEENEDLLEMYVPIVSDSKTIGIIETYASFDVVNESLASLDSIIFAIVFSSISVVVITVFLVFINIRKNVITPILRMQDATRRISSGDFKIVLNDQGFDEIKELSADITNMTTDLKRQRDELTKSERLAAIGNLAARLAHDLRNPLTTIRTTVEMLTKSSGSSDEKTDENVMRLDRSIARMTHQIDNVLDFVRVKPIQFETAKVSDILAKSLERVTVPDGIRITLPESDEYIRCDMDQMEVVFSNLFHNSIQAISGAGTIDVRVLGSGDRTVIDFVDSGPGVPEEFLANLFEPLFTTKQTGTGLGLVSCKNIIQSHSGSISFKNSPTTFSITLPRVAKIVQSVK